MIQIGFRSHDLLILGSFIPTTEQQKHDRPNLSKIDPIPRSIVNSKLKHSLANSRSRFLKCLTSVMPKSCNCLSSSESKIVQVLQLKVLNISIAEDTGRFLKVHPALQIYPSSGVMFVTNHFRMHCCEIKISRLMLAPSSNNNFSSLRFL